MTKRTKVLGGVFVLLGIPVALAAIEAVSYYSRYRHNGSIGSSGDKREYVLHVPKSYDATKPIALVISMHGAGLWGAGQMETSRWNEVADREGFLVVYPSAAAIPGPNVWQVNRGRGRMRDVRFIGELIDKLQASYNIDPARIYANGLSNGGGMSFVLSCTMSDRIAAVGLVGSAQTLPWDWCTDRHAVPMIAFHGTADSMTPYDGGTSPVSRSHSFPSISKWASNWARRNRCDASPVESKVAVDVTRIEYPHCADDAAVVLYRIEGGGHTWPNGGPMPEWALGPVNRNIDATEQMWAFFRAHPLPKSR